MPPLNNPLAAAFAASQPAGGLPAGSRAPGAAVGPGTPGAGAQTLRGGIGQQNPFDLAEAWSSYYGGQTAHGLVSNMQNGQAPAMSAVGPVNGAAPTTAEAAPGPSPQEAGTNNAAQPGVYNGNPAIGVPSAEVSAAPSANAPSAPAPLPKPPAPAPAPAPAPPREGGMQILGAEAQQTGGESQDPVAAPPQGEEKSLSLGATVEQAAPAAAAEEQASVTNEPTAAPGAPTFFSRETGEAFTGETFAFGGRTFDKAKPAWYGLPGREQDTTNFNRQHELISDTMGNRAREELRGFPQFAHVTLPDENPLSGPVQIWPGMTAVQMRDAFGSSDLGILAGTWQNLELQLAGMSPTVGDANQQRQRQDLVAQIEAIKGALAPYGVTFGAGPQPPQGAPGGDEDDGGENDGGENDGGENDDGNQDGGDGSENPALDEGGDVIGGPEYPGSETDLSGLTGSDFQAQMKPFLDRYGPDRGPLMFEMAQAWAQQQNQDNNRQSGVDIYRGGIEGYQGSDAYKGITSLTGNILANPTTTNWDLVRNKSVTDSDESFKATQDALSQSFARRGIDAASGAGIAGELNRSRAGDIASRLGDLEIQRGVVDRQQEIEALRAGIGGFAATSGFDVANYSNLSNLITGNPSQYGNFASGVGAGFMNADATQAAIDQANDAGKFTWGDAAELAAKLAAAAAAA